MTKTVLCCAACNINAATLLRRCNAIKRAANENSERGPAPNSSCRAKTLFYNSSAAGQLMFSFSIKRKDDQKQL